MRAAQTAATGETAGPVAGQDRPLRPVGDDLLAAAGVAGLSGHRHRDGSPDGRPARCHLPLRRRTHRSTKGRSGRAARPEPEFDAREHPVHDQSGARRQTRVSQGVARGP